MKYVSWFMLVIGVVFVALVAFQTLRQAEADLN